MSTVTTERIIGDSLEINGNILYDYSVSKLPKFIKDIRSNYYRSRLIKTVSKLRNANVPLSTDNLVEYFAYIYNNFPSDPTYKSINEVKHITKNDEDIWEGIIGTNEYCAVIKANAITKELVIDYVKKSAGGWENYSKVLASKSLDGSKVSDISKEIDELNIIIIKDMTDYIIDTISLYNIKRGDKK